MFAQNTNMTTHRLGGKHQDVDRTPCGGVSQNDRVLNDNDNDNDNVECTRAITRCSQRDREVTLDIDVLKLVRQD